MNTKLLFFEYIPNYEGRQWLFTFDMHRLEYVKGRITSVFQTSYTEKEMRGFHTPEQLRCYKAATIYTTCGKRKTLLYI